MTKREITYVCITVLIMCIPMAIIAHNDQRTPLSSAIYDWNKIKVEATKTGEKRQFLQAPTPTLDELELHVTTLNPGEAPHPPHQHPDEELIIVKEGIVESTVNKTTKRVGPGSVIFQASNQLHGIRNVGATQAVYYVIKWKTEKTPRGK
ncbi:cupin domain-containing protein [Chitinophaga pinensis]|uniref:Cupin 2 conserved barrel domain protein n=1 Tax=Chitinophaga pinensis (strain ATCC 43595 / DSM 2588 / LMG 13176 / NBRC 15968 / NCIMB 11800 / UQM 2034) TaxID=485918 RepID=A0A979G6J2_CHIPD|nr:cupin domain-containing protein [Chitinophaga pinensis]ACU61722.1 Cupin 2 conserved barrel domain protein [Chitinophaga pinensis DSM 2588]